MPSVNELIYSTRKSVARKIWEFFTKDRPITKVHSKKNPKKIVSKEFAPVVDSPMRTK